MVFHIFKLWSYCSKQKETSLSAEVRPNCDLVDPLPLFFELSPSDLGWPMFCSLMSKPEKSRMPTCTTRTLLRSTTHATPSTNEGERRARRSWRRRRPRGEVMRSKGRVLPKPCDRKTGHTAFCLSTFPPLQTHFEQSPGSNIWIEDADLSTYDPCNLWWKGLSAWNICTWTELSYSSRLRLWS